MRYGVTLGRASRGHVCGQNAGRKAGMDTMRRQAQAWPPEVLQAAQILGVHPRQVLAQVRLQRKLNKLAAQFRG